METNTIGKKIVRPDFVVIDDDTISNMICQMIILNALPGAKIDIFTEPQKGLDYIHTLGAGPGANSVILFLDITMPGLSGWEVLDEIKKSSPAVLQRLTIYMLSSSVIPHDQQTAANDPFVSSYIIKPISHVKLQAIFSDHL